MRFFHIADVHLGGYREPKMKELVLESFSKTIELVIQKKCDFLLISGDLFNTSHPGIDELKFVVSKLKKLKNHDIHVYSVAGSHDYSASGKTMLDVLEEAGLITNVVKGEVIDGKLRLHFTTDKKTGAKITGMLGKRGMLEKHYYEDLDRENLEAEQGFKIFMFHTAIDELKPKEMERMESAPISLLPRGFDYYAGGHVHIIEHKNLPGYKNVIYPGPIYPMNMHELEALENGALSYYDDGKIEKIRIPSKQILKINIEIDKLDAQKAKEKIIDQTKDKDYADKIVLFRVEGKLSFGKTSDLNLSSVLKKISESGAYFVMKNTSKLSSKEFEEINVETDSQENIEEKVINEHLGKSKLFLDKQEEKEFIKKLMNTLSSEKKEGEKVGDYEKRIKQETEKIIR